MTTAQMNTPECDGSAAVGIPVDRRVGQRSRGYAAIGLYQPKTPANVGSVLRAAHCYGTAFVAKTGQRYHGSSTDTMKAYRHLPLLQVDDLFDAIPHDCVPVAVDMIDGARDLTNYVHPERAFYIFGPEDGTLGRVITDRNWHAIVRDCVEQVIDL